MKRTEQYHKTHFGVSSAQEVGHVRRGAIVLGLGWWSGFNASYVKNKNCGEATITRSRAYPIRCATPWMVVRLGRNAATYVAP